MVNKKILIVSVHPDDETLGCGGTILKHLDNQDSITIMLVTDGNKMQLDALINICDEQKIKLIRLGFPEINLSEVKLSNIITSFSNVFNSEKPEIVYLPNRTDVHSDHRKTFEASQACIKTFRYPFIKKVLMMEIISETDFSPALPENVFIPNIFIDISIYFESKIAMIQKFDSELLDSPYTRSLESLTALNRYRGSQINAKYAESFMLIKEIL
jgi:LmbE family N-acetylglucosaminyl deacetylase